MTVYQQLQLNAAGSKAYIKKAPDKKEMVKRILIYILKVMLTSVFCMAVVTAFTVLFGQENSTVGVVVLLALLVLRVADFGIRSTHGIGVIFLVFGILTAGPRLANILDPIPAFFVNTICILGILVLSCHNVIMSNHSTFILGYLLLWGYDVTGRAYLLRAAALLFGAVICALIFYRNQKNRNYRRTFMDLFREFDLYGCRTQWYLKFTFTISSALLLASALDIPRAMWIGIAVMSTLLPFAEDSAYRRRRRVPFNIIGGLVYLALFYILPESLFSWIGIISGIGVGFSASYSFQTIFNTFGAVNVAAGTFGMAGAIILRVFCNAFGVFYGYVFDKAVSRLYLRSRERMPKDA